MSVIKEGLKPTKYDTERLHKASDVVYDAQPRRRKLGWKFGVIGLSLLILGMQVTLLLQNGKPMQLRLKIQVPDVGNEKETDPKYGFSTGSGKVLRFDSLLGDVNYERRRHIDAACKRSFDWQDLSNIDHQEILRNLEIDDDKKTILCRESHAAVHTLGAQQGNKSNVSVRTLGAQQGNKSNVSVHTLGAQQGNNSSNKTSTNLMQKDQLLAKLQSDDYFKILIARHPIDRLASAFTNDEQTSESRSQIDAPNRFTEFVVTLVDTINKHETIAIPFLPTQDTCFPCAIKYDYIVKYETRYNDIERLTQVFPAEEQVYLDATLKRVTNTATMDSTTMKKSIGQLRGNQFEQLVEYYGLDLEMFGYDWRFDSDGISLKYCSNTCLSGVCC